MKPYLALFALLPLSACVRSPSVVVDTLPLRRVVIYRNGVGYFERHGRTDRDHVEFRVRQSEVGDFLATLAVMERGGSSVRSAAFPMPQDPAPGAPPPRPDARRTVRLTLDGAGHDLVVGYMAETPIWRPSYRLVFGAHDTVQLQAWGIVQNISGEDWSSVRLSLVAGTPVAFRSELAEPMISPRPLVTDRGEVLDAVPRGDTTLAQDEAASTPAPVTTQQAQSGGYANGAPAAPHASAARGPRRAPSAQPGRPAYDAAPASTPYTIAATPAPPPPPPMSSAPRSVASLAAVSAMGGTTRYDLPTLVTVPDRSATMVLLVSRDVPGERMYLFAPDPGVAESSYHPFEVARFRNASGALLERGPLAIFGTDAFLGQGLLEPLPDGASATVPFSLERSVTVESSTTDAQEGSRLVHVAQDDVLIERFTTARVTYRVRNGMDHALRVMVRVALPTGAVLYQPPAGSETNPGSALVPVPTPARGLATTTVQTRVPFTVHASWADDLAAEAIDAWLRDGHPPATVAAQLRAALDLRHAVSLAMRERATLDHRRADLSQGADETRANLLTIERNPRAADLRARLTARLAQSATELDQVTRRIVELDTQIGEQRIRLAEAVRAIDVDTALPPATPVAR